MMAVEKIIPSDNVSWSSSPSSSWLNLEAFDVPCSPTVIGIMSCIVGSFCGSIGDNMVKRAFSLAGHRFPIEEIWKCPMWLVGIFLSVVINTVCTVVALAFATASVVTSFAAVHIFWNTVIAKTWLREKTSRWDLIGTICIITGIVLIVWFSGKHQPIGNVDSFVSHLTNFGVSCFIISTVLLLCCLAFLATRGEDSLPATSYQRTIQRFSTAAVSGICGGMTNVFAKAFVLILGSIAFEGSRRVLTDPSTYIVLILTIIFALTQFLFLNKALQRFEAITVVPIINALLITSGALGGYFLFKEIPSRYDLYIIGIVSVTAGVAFLAYGKYTAEIQAIETGLIDLPTPYERVPEEDTFSCFEWLCHPLTDLSLDIMSSTNAVSLLYPPALILEPTVRRRPSVQALERRNIAAHTREMHRTLPASVPSEKEDCNDDDKHVSNPTQPLLAQ
eukprot:GHVQ01015742.1.p1 GENE.GHVQ01015742.1~~GHVQ01015742.1.p1  ORF type:complete len:448 (+),score=37.10 GHVQ01015742.1:1475-2818(+)